MDANYYEKWQCYVETQSEEYWEASPHTVSFVDLLKVLKASLFPVEPEVQTGDREFRQEYNQKVTEFKLFMLKTVSCCDAEAGTSYHANYKGPDGTEYKGEHIDLNWEEISHFYIFEF